MPRYVDPEQRKAEIIAAVIDVMGEGGFSSLTIRALAKRMGGSSTLITHYFPTREALLEGLLSQTLQDAEKERAALLEMNDPRERLHAVLAFFLPDTPEALALERVRVAMVPYMRIEPAVHEFFQRLEPGMRGLMRAALEEFVDPDELDGMVDILRVWTSGLVLSAVEHPEIWTPERQRAALDGFVDSFALPLSRQSRRRKKVAS